MRLKISKPQTKTLIERAKESTKVFLWWISWFPLLQKHLQCMKQDNIHICLYVKRSDNSYCLRCFGSQGARAATENFLNFAKLNCFWCFFHHIFKFEISALCSVCTIKKINMKVRKIWILVQNRLKLRFLDLSVKEKAAL